MIDVYDPLASSVHDGLYVHIHSVQRSDRGFELVEAFKGAGHVTLRTVRVNPTSVALDEGPRPIVSELYPQPHFHQLFSRVMHKKMREVTLLLMTVFLVLILLMHLVNVRRYNVAESLTANLILHNNDGVPVLDPPAEIVLDENALSCHRTPTRCDHDGECQLCRENLALCYRFNERVILELDDNRELVIQPGESYCLALDNRSARSCNPNTGIWVLRHVDNENYALICHCTMPGLVTQMHIYDDCSFPVGCKPHGFIADINTSPLACVCDDGYVPELSATNTPYCRPMVMRDVMLNPNYYHRPPCRHGFLPAEHPAFDVVYRRLIGANVCLPDPCSIDPITGEKTGGWAFYEDVGGADDGPLVMCICNVDSNLFPVYNADSMMAAQYTREDREITNACLRPLLVGRRDVRGDLKVFWGRNSLKSDADIVLHVFENQVHEKYRVLLYRRTMPHPVADDLTTPFILKFQLNTAYVRYSMYSENYDVFQGYWRLNHLRTGSNHCPLPGIGQCRSDQSCGVLICSNVSCLTAARPPLLYRSSCYFFRQNRSFHDVGNISQICIWNRPGYYYSDNVPVTFYINALCATDSTTEARTVYFTNTRRTVPEEQFSTAVQLLDTYPLYSS
ncbi:PIF-1 [Plodia interpunctella granulovirus]|uniref:PIF-1 n=1 Tax=Plodia interpunctella granulovirus TaxID=262175 RepID=A0A1L5JH19_9BBAC|nr:PIF-1 [Plodia interpunctella granulovirus]APO13946.1 PIF-1 [Plodia interpunctella granulovirus]